MLALLVWEGEVFFFWFLKDDVVLEISFFRIDWLIEERVLATVKIGFRKIFR